MTFRRPAPVVVAGLVAMVLIFGFSAVTIVRQKAWQDEVFVASTAWSMVRSHQAVLSVLAQYRTSVSPIRFYGPVSFEAAAWLMRIFGLSMVTWRLLCLAGAALTALAGTLLVRAAGADRWGQFATALALALSGAIWNFLPGRWDYPTAGLFLLGMAAVVRVLREGASAGTVRLLLGGACMGLSLGSTPRSLTLISSLIVAVLVTALWFRATARLLLAGTGAGFAVAFYTQTALLWLRGLTPFSWFRFVRTAAIFFRREGRIAVSLQL